MRVIASVQSKRGSSRGLVHYISHSKIEIEKEPAGGREIFNAFSDSLSVKSANNSLKIDTTRRRPSNDELHHLVLSFRPDDYRKLGRFPDKKKKALKSITRAAMKALETELGAERLAWAASVHLNTKNPHVHIAIQKQYFTKEIEKRILTKIPREALPHHQTQGARKEFISGFLIDAATERMEEIIVSRRLSEKEHEKSKTDDISSVSKGQEQDPTNEHISVEESAETKANERDILRNGILADYSLRRMEAEIDTLIKRGHEMRFVVFDTMSGKKRRLSLQDIERRKLAKAKQNGEERAASEIDPDASAIRQIKTIQLKMLSKKESAKHELKDELENTLRQAAEIRAKYRSQGRKLPVPFLSNIELDRLQQHCLEISDFRRFAYLERIRSELTHSGEIQPRTKHEIRRLIAQRDVSLLRSKHHEKTYREFSEGRYYRRFKIDDRQVSLAQLEGDPYGKQRSVIAVLTDKLTIAAKKVMKTSDDSTHHEEAARIRHEILTKIDEQLSEVVKAQMNEEKKTRILDNILEKSAEKFGRDATGVFTVEQMAETETLALRLGIKSTYERNWHDQKSLVEDAHAECPEFQRLLKTNWAQGFGETQKRIIAGRALAREVIAGIEKEKAAETLAYFKKAKRFQKFPVNNVKTGELDFLCLKDIELPRSASILDRLVDEVFEGRNARRMRRSLAKTVNAKEKRLKDELAAAKEVVVSASKIASEFKQPSFLKFSEVQVFAPIFTPAEISLIEIRAEKTQNVREVNRLKSYLKATEGSSSHSLIRILRDFENPEHIMSEPMKQSSFIHEAPGKEIANDRSPRPETDRMPTKPISQLPTLPKRGVRGIER